jgi:hypothetical protein
VRKSFISIPSKTVKHVKFYENSAHNHEDEDERENTGDQDQSAEQTHSVAEEQDLQIGDDDHPSVDKQSTAPKIESIPFPSPHIDVLEEIGDDYRQKAALPSKPFIKNCGIS